MAKAGRPTKLTPEVQDKICAALRGGNWRKVAARWAGIGERTFERWMKQGGEESKGPLADFVVRVIEAEEAAEIRMVALVMTAAAKDPRHAEWWLERKHPDRWGRIERVKAEVSGDINITHWWASIEQAQDKDNGDSDEEDTA